MIVLPLSDFISSGTPYRFMKLSRKLMTSPASVDLHIRTTGHLLYRSIPIRMYDSPVTSLLCILPEEVICIFRPGSVNTGRLTFPVIGDWYSKIYRSSSKLRTDCIFSSISFRIPADQNMLDSASVFVDPGGPN